MTDQLHLVRVAEGAPQGVGMHQHRWLVELVEQHGHDPKEVTAGYPRWALEKKMWLAPVKTAAGVLADLARVQRRAMKKGILRFAAVPEFDEIEGRIEDAGD